MDGFKARHRTKAHTRKVYSSWLNVDDDEMTQDDMKQNNNNKKKQRKKF